MKKNIPKHDINGLHKRDKKPCRVVQIYIHKYTGVAKGAT